MSATTATNLTKPWWDVSALDPAGTPSANGATKTALAPAGGWQNMAVDTNATPLAMPGNASTNSAMAGGYTGNPWQDYQNPSDNAGWNYTTDPLFDSSKNVKRWDLAQTGPQSEDDRAKAYRLAFDYLKQKYQITSPGQATQQQMDEGLLYGIQRVKTDLSAPENAAMGGWQSSPWYGYDKYLPGSQGGTGTGGLPATNTTIANQGSGLAGAASGGTQAGQAAAGNATQGQGGTSVSAPMGSGLTAGAASAGATTQPGGNTPTTTAQGTPLGGFYAGNPNSAVNDFLAQHNVQVGDHNPWAEFLRKLATGIADPIISTLPQGANGQPALDQLNNLPQMLSNLIYGNGGQAFGNIANYGNTVGQEWQSKLAGMDAPTAEKLIASIQAFKNLGNNPYQQQFNQQQMSDIFSRYDTAVKNGAVSGAAPNPNWLMNPQNDPYGIFK